MCRFQFLNIVEIPLFIALSPYQKFTRYQFTAAAWVLVVQVLADV
jgi:hypothetical protein